MHTVNKIKKNKEARVSVLDQAKDRKARVMYDVWEANTHLHSRSEKG